MATKVYFERPWLYFISTYDSLRVSFRHSVCVLLSHYHNPASFSEWRPKLLWSVTMPCKNFFLSSLIPTHSYTHSPTSFPVTTSMSLNCNPSDSTTGMSLNCAQMSSCMMLNCPPSSTMLTCTVPLNLMFPISLPRHLTPQSSSSMMLNCRNLRTYANMPSEPYGPD
jgi:hypothetical protein